MVKKAVLFFAIILMSAGCIAGVYSGQKDKGEENPTVELFNKRCSGCHGFDGRPAKPNLPNIPNFTDPEFHKKHTDEQLIESITEGKPPIMPDYGSKLNKDQIKSLVAYIRTFPKKGK